jgi:hypothetical protein
VRPRVVLVLFACLFAAMPWHLPEFRLDHRLSDWAACRFELHCMPYGGRSSFPAVTMIGRTMGGHDLSISTDAVAVRGLPGQAGARVSAGQPKSDRRAWRTAAWVVCRVGAGRQGVAMCGLFASQLSRDLLARTMAVLGDIPNTPPSWNVAPTRAASIRHNGP